MFYLHIHIMTADQADWLTFCRVLTISFQFKAWVIKHKPTRNLRFKDILGPSETQNVVEINLKSCFSNTSFQI